MLVPIDPTKEYKPSEIAENGWILNTKGKKDYLYVLNLIKGGKLRAKNHATLGQTKYFKVLGSDILTYKNTGYNIPVQQPHEENNNTESNSPGQNILPHNQ